MNRRMIAAALALAACAAPAAAEKTCGQAYAALQTMLMDQYNMQLHRSEADKLAVQIGSPACAEFRKTELTKPQPTDIKTWVAEPTCDSVRDLATKTAGGYADNACTPRRRAILAASQSYLNANKCQPPSVDFALCAPQEALAMSYLEGTYWARAPVKQMAPYGLNDFGLSGNFAAYDMQNSKALAGLGGRFSMLGSGALFDGDGRYGENMFVRLGAGGNVSFHNDGTNRNTIGAVYNRVGLGVFEDNGVYYAPISNLNYDGQDRNGIVKNSLVWVAGGELGKKFVRNDRLLVYAGIYSGIGILQNRNGMKNATNDDGTPQLNEDGTPKKAIALYTRNVPAFGVTISGRFGKPNKSGTVSVDASGELLSGVGGRADAIVDVNVSRNIRLGAGVRHLSYASPYNGRLEMTVPALRITLGMSNDAKEGAFYRN